ncbi:MAG TPA: RelA/SpoT domain-containing protein [Terracidiphilus sp.]|nr:RelA/SpoT domain-containing protein [Terracidiphilus sp.]
MCDEASIKAIVNEYKERHFELSTFLFGVRKWFEDNPRLGKPPCPIVHSVKTRMKDADHLVEKVIRKRKEGADITSENLLFSVTDLAGIRVLHLHQEQFRTIHEELLQKANGLGDWFIAEPPKAYTWDPECRQFFESLDIGTQVKESFYTSVHYLIRPRRESPICCEIQVRTLFEEIWGEVDHALNYPNPTEKVACREQLRALARLVGAGSRLVDSIFRSESEG